MNQRDNHHKVNDLVSLSGWVFADLLLGLFVIFLVSSRGATAEEIASILLPTATFTATPTRTATPTFTPTATRTATPTFTPTATRTPVSSTPALSVGLDPSPYRISLKTDPSLFFSSSPSDKRSADEMFRSQLQNCLEKAKGSRAGMVLAAGYNPKDDYGQELAKRALSILRDEFADIFGVSASFRETALRDLHVLSNDPLLNGSVNVDVFFLSDPRVSLPKALLGTQCVPPPKSWCQGDTNDSQKLLVYNWDNFPALDFVLDRKPYKVKPANGIGSGENSTVGCFTVGIGSHTWQAGSATGSFDVIAGKDPEPIRLCHSPAVLCAGGPSPTTGGPGTK